MTSTDFLDEQLELYQNRISNESWDSASFNEAFRPQLDDAVAHALFIISRIRRRNRVLSDASRAAQRLVPPREQTDYLIRLYKSWLEVTAKVLTCVDAMEKLGFVARRASKLRHVYFEVSSLNFDVERVTRSIIDAIQGRGKPLREAADEFRRRRYGRSA